MAAEANNRGGISDALAQQYLNELEEELLEMKIMILQLQVLLLLMLFGQKEILNFLWKVTDFLI